MTEDSDDVTVEACALLRGDLPLLRPTDYDDIDAALVLALKPQGPQAASRIRRIAEVAGLGPRLRSLQDTLLDMARLRSAMQRGDSGFQGLPGVPGLEILTIWTCPKDPPGHFRRLQRGRAEDMGVCTEHKVALVREGVG